MFAFPVDRNRLCKDKVSVFKDSTVETMNESTWGFLPCGQSKDCKRTAVYRPPKPPPKMQILGALLKDGPA